jgi:hypothetical protein
MTYHQTSPLKTCTNLAVNTYNLFLLHYLVSVGLSEKPTFANNKKIQSSKSWYLKIALILCIKNSLPRGVVDRTVNTNLEQRGMEPTMQHLRKSENHQNKFFVFYNSFYTDVQAAVYSEPQPGPSAYFPAW